MADFCLKENNSCIFFALDITIVPLDKGMYLMACDYVFVGDKIIDFEIPGTLGIIYNHIWLQQKHKERVYPLYKLAIT